MVVGRGDMTVSVAFSHGSLLMSHASSASGPPDAIARNTRRGAWYCPVPQDTTR